MKLCCQEKLQPLRKIIVNQPKVEVMKYVLQACLLLFLFDCHINVNNQHSDVYFSNGKTVNS